MTVFDAAILVLLAIASPPPADTFRPMNRDRLERPATDGSFRFLAAGHIYGNHAKRSVYPAASMLAHAAALHDGDPWFLMLLGDVVLRAEDSHFDALDRHLLARLRFPVFNAPGNHDLLDRAKYEARYGSTYGRFRVGPSLFVVLDSERDDGVVRGPQETLLRDAIDRTRSDPAIRNLFVFSHRLLFAIGNPAFANLLPFVNDPGAHQTSGEGFAGRILPALRRLPGKSVFLVAGDVGRDGALSLLCVRDPEANVTYLATGIYDDPRDLILRFDVSANGAVTIEPISLSGAAVRPIADYDADYWIARLTDTAAPVGGRRRDPPGVLALARSRRFWAGFAVASVLGAAAWLLVRRRRRAVP